jgi:hypothetical protein
MKSPLASKSAIAAGIVACAGLLIAGYALWPYLNDGHERAEAVVRSPSPQQLRLTPEILDTDTANAAQSAVDAAVKRVKVLLDAGGPDRAGGRLSSARRQDLLEAFGDQLRTTIDGDYQRDLNARMARGMRGPDEPPTEADMERWKARADWTRGVRIGVEELEVRWIRRGGRAMVDEAHDGFSSTAFHSEHTPFGPFRDSDLSSDVIEIRLPMGLRPVRVDDGLEPRGAALVGYQFAWHRGRAQWTPYANVIYRPEGETYAGLPFY